MGSLGDHMDTIMVIKVTFKFYLTADMNGLHSKWSFHLLSLLSNCYLPVSNHIRSLLLKLFQKSFPQAAGS